MSKRKASLKLDDPGEGSSKAGKVTQQLKDKTAAYETDEKARDAAGYDENASTDAAWILKLAIHLASEPKFIKFMDNPQPLEFIIVSKEWLSGVYLEGRSKKFTNFKRWDANWWNDNVGESFRPQVIEKAAEIVQQANPVQQRHIENTLAPLPTNDQKHIQQREDLFKVQSTRQKVVLLIKRATDTQHGLAKKLVVTINDDNDVVVSDAMKGIVEELAELDAVRDNAKSLLKQSSLNKAGIKLLDKLLQTVPADTSFGTLYMLGWHQMFDIVTDVDEDAADTESIGGEGEDVSQATPSDPAVIAAAIQTKYNIPIDFLGNKTLNDVKKNTDVMFTRSKKLTSFEPIQVSDVTRGAVFLDGAALNSMDAKCAKVLEDSTAEINIERFKLNFRDFEQVVDRPTECANKPKGHWYFQRQHNRVEVARDNIVHVRRLVCELLDNEMIENDADTLEKLQLVLRRMYCLLAIIHGCSAEPAYWLTIMDQLLEDLAELVIGSVDPKLESVRMHNAALALNKKTASAKRKLNINDFKLMEREHKAREVFAEVARFYRGAVIILHAASSYRKSNEVEEETRLWYTGLLNMFSKCGHSSCLEQIKVERGGSGWSVSVAVKDARLGFPAERSTVSTNRIAAYECLWDLIGFSRFHVAHVPFFHYFAHLWHPACRPFRGKSGLLEDITMTEGGEEMMEE